MSPLDEPPRYAAAIAPVIDRVHLGVHVAGRPRGRELIEAWGLRPGFLIDLRYILAARPMTRTDLDHVYRYGDPLQRGAEIEAQLAQGTLAEEGDALVATQSALRFIADLYDVHAQVTAELWAGQPVQELGALVGRLLAASAGGPAFAVAAPPYEPEGVSPGVVLFNRLAAFRFHRADAHAAAWQEAGLTAAQATALEAGSLRDAIEAETNRRAAVPFAALSTAERFTLLAGLGALR